MSDRWLLIIAVSATVVNAAASILRTRWAWDKRRNWLLQNPSDHGPARRKKGSDPW